MGGACMLLAGAGQNGLALSQGGPTTIDVSKIRPGMKGFGLTVFRGTQPERFAVEVIDVIHNFKPSQDMILVRTDHPLLDRAKVVAGMSGSPIYLEGRLAGAYAYGWAFEADPVAGVTPIKNMLRELRRPLDPEIWDILGTFPGRSRRTAHTRRTRRLAHQAVLSPYLGRKRRDALWALRQAAPPPPEDTHLTRAQTPLMLAGFDATATDVLRRALAPYSLLPLQAGGGGPRAKGATTHASYVDGGAIGVQLMRGDINATAVGTVTHVAGQRLIGFGHPMMNVGQTAMPTTTAEVIHVLSSLRRSFKMARPLSPRGAMVHDRQSAIVVDSQMRAQTIPVHLKVEGASGAPRTEWNLEVASGRTLTPALVFTGLLNALQATTAGSSDVFFRAASSVSIPGHGKVGFVDEGHLPGGAAGASVLARMRVFSAIEAAYGNPFERARIDGVDITLNVANRDDVALIVDAAVAHQEVEPGKQVDVYVTLRRYDGAEEVKRIPLAIPYSAAGGKLEIEIASGEQVRIERPKPRNLDDLLAGLKEEYPATSLILSTKLPSKGLRTRGHVVRRLPGSVLDALQGQSDSDKPMMFSTKQHKEVPLGRVVYGQAKLKLEVREEPRR